MSSILKALEKAEESNSKRPAGESGLIRSRRHRPTWVMPVAVFCGAAVATLATYAAMGGFSRHAPVASAPAVVAKAATVVVAPLNPVVETPAAAPAQTLPAEPAGATPAPIQQAVPVVNPAPSGATKAVSLSPPKIAPLVSPKAAPLPSLRAGSLGNPKVAAQPIGKARAIAKVAAPQPVSVQPAAVQVAPAPVTAPVVAPAPALPELKVSGIAWQGKGESSFAVVNGRAVLQGATVDGFKVLEIHQDVVKFSNGQKTFEVPLGEEEK
jgi:general secretion pathway protein B